VSSVTMSIFCVTDFGSGSYSNVVISTQPVAVVMLQLLLVLVGVLIVMWYYLYNQLLL